MEKRDPKSSPPDLVSKDDGGLWMKTDSSPEANHTESQSDKTKVNPPGPALITRYYSVMEDEGADDVFIPPPPPSYMAPLLPTEGSTHAMMNNPSVTAPKGAADATEAKANPSGLDWHHGEEQLMAEHNKVDEVKTSAAQTSRESMDTVSLSKDKNSSLPKDIDQVSMEDKASMMEMCYDSSGRQHQENITGDEELNAKPEDILSGGQHNRRESEMETEKCQKQVPSCTGEYSENETGTTTSEDICGLAETNLKLTTENYDSNSVETNTPMLSSLSMIDGDFESCRSPEFGKCNQNRMDATTNKPQVPEIPKNVSNDDEEQVDTRSLDYNHTKYDWVMRESDTSETQVSKIPICEGSVETETKEEQGQIATDIQQGEHLLQRLQQVQMRQDVHILESSHNSQQVVQETRGETRGETKGVLGTEIDYLKSGEVDLTDVNEREESTSQTAGDKGERMNLTEKVENKSEDVKTKKRISTSTTSPPTARTEREDFDDGESDGWAPADLSPADPYETSSAQISFLSIHHQTSATETSIDERIHKAAEEKQNLQRAAGCFDLEDNPDVLEIPFKTNILLEPFTTAVAQPIKRSDWQFSEEKMQKEISQEIQRELVLVNQGKIPGEYSKGEVRQLKETKLLFEAFQQDNTEGPTRHRKVPTSMMKGHVYPSVLERTRSLEMLSLKSRPILRAHSLRLYKSTSETEKSPEDLRSISPTGGSRDKTRLFPYPKQDKHVRLYRSMDSIRSDSSVVEMGNKAKKENTAQESPILKQNPFYKLRPALALQPEVEKDIREAKEREEELRRQRCTLYGENRQKNEDGEKSQFTPVLAPDIGRHSRGKLERVWPPPSKKDQTKSEQIQRETKVHRAGGQKAQLWQLWESGLVNGQSSKENN